jgi:pimeloyl-ACP methyl ester carboxylesterase
LMEQERTMRLAAKRRAQWIWADPLERGDHRQALFRWGATDVVRLGQGEPIVLVPGLAGGWKLLAPLAHRLARRHEVILYNHRGEHSPLGLPQPAHLSGYAEDLADLLDQLRLERPLVFGVSFGGAVALELAVEQPQRLGALVLSGVEAKFRVGLGATIARRVLERFPLPNNNDFVNQFFNLLHAGKPEPGPLPEFIVERCWETDQGVMAHRLRLLEGFDVTDRLWRVEVPTLVLAGSGDAIVPAARQRALAEAIVGARYASLEGAGHIGFLTHRAEVTRQVGRLVRDRRTSLC